MEEVGNSSKEIPAKKKWNEYCFVPLCRSTRVTTPEKIFVNVPDAPILRRKWLIAARRDLKTMPLSESSHLRCCADHFNLEEDAENYMRWKIMGGPIRIKKSVVPHVFECQSRPSTGPLTERPVVKKRKMINLLSSISNASRSTTTTVDDLDFPPNDDAAPPVRHQHDINCDNSLPLLTTDKGIQVRSPFRSKLIQTDGRKSNSVATSPLKVGVRSISTSPMKVMEAMISVDSDTCTSDEENDSIQFDNDDSSSDEFLDSDEEFKNVKEESFRLIKIFIEKDPKLYLGIPTESYIILSLLCGKVKTSVKNIMLCLKKIKLNDHLKVLGNEFGLHYSTVSRVLRDTMPMISEYMIDLIYWPEEESRLRTLPTAFIANFSDVSCIIDCLEIAIEKPSDALHQAQSWSQYKKANTIKYLIACLPNGFINFISEGYLGRASDEAISMDCGFLENIPPGSTVMADRGFKHLERELVRRSCKLVRPPSISSGQQMCQSDVHHTKKVASLRIHVERVIGRIRDFAILKPSSVMDHNLVSLSDHMIVIACGLTNLNAQIVRT